MTEAGAPARPSEVDGGNGSPPEDPRWYEQSVSDHPAATILLVSLMAALPLLVFWAGRNRWFYLDEWDFLSGRSASNFGDLMRPHNENWSTIPVLIYRGLFNVFHLHSYWPYQVPVVVAHLAVVGLLWIVMRRSGVNQWVALLASGLLLLFGSGYENIVWAFQVGFTGALAFGLGQLVMADHDGPLDRRDWLGLGLGLCALLCSSVGVTTVVVVGVAALLRRGWRAAAFHTVPLALIYLVWTLAEKPEGPANPFRVSQAQVAHHVADWDVASVGYTFGRLGHYPIVGVVLAVVLIVGLALAWTKLGFGGVRRRQSLVVGTLVGWLVFMTLSGDGRWFYGSSYSSAPRYLYMGVALVLPALAVAAWALIQRWRVMTPVVVLILLIGVPGNLSAFDHQLPAPIYASVGKQVVASLADSPLITQVPPEVQVNPVGYPGLTAGWLAQAGRHSWTPRPRISPLNASVVPITLGLNQLPGPPPTSGACQVVKGHVNLPTTKGYTFWVREPVPGSTTYIPNFGVTTLDSRGRPNSYRSIFQPAYGNLFRVQVGGIAFQVTPLAASAVPLALCH